jgi:hypothetical protein
LREAGGARGPGAAGRDGSAAPERRSRTRPAPSRHRFAGEGGVAVGKGAIEVRTLGRLWPVSALTHGSGGLGQLSGSTTREEAVATVREAVEAGITPIDVARDTELSFVDLFFLQGGTSRPRSMTPYSAHAA